ncbi:Uncharacterized protein DAT39_006983, partial [Clarias magur]
MEVARTQRRNLKRHERTAAFDEQVKRLISFQSERSAEQNRRVRPQPQTESRFEVFGHLMCFTISGLTMLTCPHAH